VDSCEQRGRRLAEAAARVVVAARNVVDRNMEATDDCHVVLSQDLYELADAVGEVDHVVES